MSEQPKPVVKEPLRAEAVEEQAYTHAIYDLKTALAYYQPLLAQKDAEIALAYNKGRADGFTSAMQDCEKEIERLKEMVGAMEGFIYSIDTAINMGYSSIHRDDILIYLGMLRLRLCNAALAPSPEKEKEV